MKLHQLTLKRTIQYVLAATVALVVAFTTLTPSIAQASDVLRLKYANTKSPTLGEPVAVGITWREGIKVKMNWGDGNTTVLG